MRQHRQSPARARRRAASRAERAPRARRVAAAARASAARRSLSCSRRPAPRSASSSPTGAAACSSVSSSTCDHDRLSRSVARLARARLHDGRRRGDGARSSALAPALGLSGVAPNEALKEQGRGVAAIAASASATSWSSCRSRCRSRSSSPPGLFARTFVTLATRNVGFDRESRWSSSPTSTADAHRVPSPALRRRELFERARQRRGRCPACRRRRSSFTSPLATAGWNTRIVVPGTPMLTGRQRMSWVNVVSPGWFDTYGVRLSPAATSSAATAMARRRWRSSTAHSRQRFFNGRQPDRPAVFDRRTERSRRSPTRSSASSKTHSTDRCAPRCCRRCIPRGQFKDRAVSRRHDRRSRRDGSPIEPGAQPGRRARTRRLARGAHLPHAVGSGSRAR